MKLSLVFALTYEPVKLIEFRERDSLILYLDLNLN